MKFINKILTFSALCFASSTVFAISCKQSESISLIDTASEIETLSSQFSTIDYIDVLVEDADNGQVIICGELLAQKTTSEKSTASSASAPNPPRSPAATPADGSCQFDSDCSRPMRCYSNRCVMSRAP